jgi:hypothetical protein
MDIENAATLDGREGQLRTLGDGTLVWEAQLDGDALATLLRRAMLHGGVRCETAGGVGRVQLHGCYYDAAGRTLVVEIGGLPTSAS